MLPIKMILHPTDFSDSSACAFRIACCLAHDYGARLVVLHVAPRETVYSGLIGGPTPHVYHAELKRWLDRLEMPDLRIEVEHRLLEGQAAEEILRIAQETPCDLIVMGSHGRSGLSRALVGSVAESVLRAAPCPVMTVKAPVDGRHDGDHESTRKSVMLF